MLFLHLVIGVLGFTLLVTGNSLLILHLLGMCENVLLLYVALWRLQLMHLFFFALLLSTWKAVLFLILSHSCELLMQLEFNTMSL
jgi:hypothetical protein